MQSPKAIDTDLAPRGLRFSVSVREAGTALGLALIVLIFGLLSPFFLTTRNLLEVLEQSSINACVAVGMTLVIVTGGIDLSVGSTAALAAVIGASALVAHVPIVLALLLTVGVGAGAGLVNGALVAFAGLQPFIVTLGTLSLYRAAALIYTGGNPILGIPNGFRGIFTSALAGIPTPVILVAVVAGAGWTVLRLTPLGEWLLAVGGNEEAARVSGVPIPSAKVVTYMISGGLAAIAALVLVAWLGAADPTLGNLWELQAIAASAIGGASLLGGKGSIVGSVLGAVILGAMSNGLTLLNVQAFYQLLATGLIIIAAMLIDRVTRGSR
jgi:ribose transport system permease protein